MRKVLIVALVLAAAAFGAFANGNAEKLTTVEGEVVGVQELAARVQVTLRTAEGEEVEVELPLKEMARLQLRIEQQIRVSGVYIGVPAGEQARVRARIVARVVNAGGQETQVEDPIRLTTRDREQIRLYEREQLQVQTQDGSQTQTQTQTQTRTQSQTGDGSGSGPASGDK
jgi:hypothetical protein